MKNKKGQALVEFIIILPVCLLLIFCVVDFGRVISLKNSLENKVSDVVMLYQNGNTPEEIKDIINKKEKNDLKIEFISSGDYIIINVSKKIKPITPGLSYVKEDVFNVLVNRVIRNE